MKATRTDVCIIGGGPAGAVAALRLKALGHQVCLIERGVTARRREGESLTPGIWPILETLALTDRVAAAGFVPAVRPRVRWGHEHEEWVEKTGPAPGLIVDRARFDGLLLAAAAERGVHLLRPATARRVQRHVGGLEVLALQGSEVLSIEARFVIDASGRGGFLPGERRPTAARTLALHAYLHGGATPDGPRVDAVEDGWYWGTRLPDGAFSTMLFLEPEVIARAGRGGLERLLRDRLAASPLFAPHAGAALLEPVRARDATPYTDPASIGHDFVKLGEAAFALDPLSSTGIEKAMRMALAGSTSVHTLLKRPASATLVFSFHADRQQEDVERHAQWAAGHYREVVRHAEQPFWRKRAEAMPPSFVEPPARPQVSDPASLLHSPVALSEEAKRVEVPCIVGDFIESRRAVRPPHQLRAVAFLGGIELAPLLDEVERGGTLLDVVRRWSRWVPMRQGLEIAGWMAAQGMLRPGDAVLR
ncbi:NAD(P)/FAD-dependent oxidoreductase [Corallococcus exercitus]|uniref:flavin-dependent monooxygenase QhpG n=1 Tax=Corallococcus exercitus TaxID=2316736 RepID=UPI0035D41A3F